VKGTQYAAMIDKKAPAQRSGILASLNMVADSLKLLPSENEANGRWSAAEWSKQRKAGCFSRALPKPRAAFATYEFVARYVSAATHEPGTDKRPQSVVCFGRTGDFAAVAATAHGSNGKP